jgi:lactate dehydrogenase-like 2-hydroxyacid dehydrogenase
MSSAQVAASHRAPGIVVAAPVSDSLIAALRPSGRVVQVGDDRSLDEPQVRKELEDATALLVSHTRAVSAELLAGSPHLKVVSTVSVGVDHIDVGAATARRIVVCNTPGVLDDAVAELTMLLMLSLSRRLTANLHAVVNGDWSRGQPLPPFGNDLRGKTLGILGMGRTGRALARLAIQGFGMRVLYHNRSGAIAGAEAALPVAYAARSDLFRRADFLSVNVDLNSDTQNSVGRHEFELMKRSAFLVNVSRGAVVDEGALIEALRTQRIAGAGLDVLRSEPPSAASPLLTLDNVVITPHIGSATVETRQEMAEVAVRNLLAVCSGTSPEAIVNPEALS